MFEEAKSNDRMRPPFRIETERTVVRCYARDDAANAISTIQKSLEHLRTWMLWAAHEPELLESKANRLQRNRDEFYADVDYAYGIFNIDESELIGGTGLHTRRGPNAFEIGYWVGSYLVGQGIATEVAAALTKVAFEVSGVSRVEIRCDPRNKASCRVPLKLGYTHETTLLKHEMAADGQLRDTMVWAIKDLDYRSSVSSDAVLRAYDSEGNSILSTSAQ